MDWLATLGLALGASWVAGYRLYALVAVLGAANHFGVCRLPGDLHVLSDPRVFGTAAVLLVVEFVADKVPWLDTGWDSVHTFIRIPAGAVLAAAAFADFDPWVKAVAMLIGGGIAFSSHATKAGARFVVNHSPEPVSNVSLSLAEDGVAGVSLLSMLWLPAVMVVVVVVATWVSWLVLRKALKMRAKRAQAP